MATQDTHRADNGKANPWVTCQTMGSTAPCRHYVKIFTIQEIVRYRQGKARERKGRQGKGQAACQQLGIHYYLQPIAIGRWSDRTPDPVGPLKSFVISVVEAIGVKLSILR